MARKRFNGVLDSPIFGDFYDGKLRFTHLTTTGNVLAASQSFESLVLGGVYDFSLNYGTVVIESKVNGGNWHIHGAYTVNSSTTATTLPALLLATTPVTPEIVQQIEALLADTEAARDAAEDAQAATEALFNGFDGSVAESLSLNSPANIDWDVVINFNDGLDIQKGYGANGSKLVTFSRASVTSNINKSGLLEQLAADKPAITKDGLNVYGSATNLILWSEDLTKSAWVKSGTCVVSKDGTLAPDGVSEAFLVDGCDSFTNRFTQSVTAVDDEIYTTGIFLKGSGNVTLVAQSGDTENLSITLTDEWKFYSHTRRSNPGRSFEVRVYGQNGNAKFYAWGGQITKTEFAAPYIKTEGVVDSIDGEKVSIPVMNNMPANSTPFTVVLDSAQASEELLTVGMFFEAGNTSFERFSLFTRTDRLRVRVGDGVNEESVVLNNVPIGKQKKRFVVKYTGSEIYAGTIEDGVFKLQVTQVDLTKLRINKAGLLAIGANGGFSQQVSRAIKNFCIIHRALTNDEIKALGAAK